MANVEKITVDLGVDASAVNDAAAALNSLAEAAHRAKSALDALFAAPETFVHVSADGREEMIFGRGRAGPCNSKRD
jgi:hypothetical protein